MRKATAIFQAASDLFIFSSVYIAIGAVLMTMQANHLFQLQPHSRDYLYFVFFSTMCSYNLHWYLTPEYETESIRVHWTHRNKDLHLLFFAAGLMGSVLFFLALLPYLGWIALGGVMTFLYTAPKIEKGPFPHLKKIAVAKTIYLAFVWMYVTTIMPFIISGKSWQTGFTLFAIARFFFIYAICIIFDYRDRNEDKKHGIRSLITYFNERGINNLFAFSLIVSAVLIFLLKGHGLSFTNITLLLVPAAITAFIYPYAKKNFSDYLYYFVLDGLMMLPSLLTFISIKLF